MFSFSSIIVVPLRLFSFLHFTSGTFETCSMQRFGASKLVSSNSPHVSPHSSIEVHELDSNTLSSPQSPIHCLCHRPQSCGFSLPRVVQAATPTECNMSQTMSHRSSLSRFPGGSGMKLQLKHDDYSKILDDNHAMFNNLVRASALVPAIMHPASIRKIFPAQTQRWGCTSHPYPHLFCREWPRHFSLLPFSIFFQVAIQVLPVLPKKIYGGISQRVKIPSNLYAFAARLCLYRTVVKQLNGPVCLGSVQRPKLSWAWERCRPMLSHQSTTHAGARPVNLCRCS